MSTESIVAICGVVALILKFAEKIYDRWQQKKVVEKVTCKIEEKAEEVKIKTAADLSLVADKVEEVKTQTADAAATVKETLDSTNAEKKEHLDRQDKALQEIKGKTEEIKEQTNGMTKKLEQAAFIAGIKMEHELKKEEDK